MSIRTDARVGTELAGYRIEALLGRGGMGDVYLALDPRLGRRVALKLLAGHLADDRAFREHFLRESHLAASLDHPNVIPIYEAGEAGGLLYIAMRYAEGTDLRRLLDTRGRLEPGYAVTLLARVADALDTAHAHGLVHRDVKPGNVLIAVDPSAVPPEHVYLSDFGLTRESTDPGRAGGGGFMGSPSYAAPELIARGPVDGRADQYALGCVLFECLAGSPPFGGDSLMALLWAQVNDAPPAATKRNPDLPAEIDAVLCRSLAKEPQQRFQSCGELLAAARAALELGEAQPRAARRAPLYHRREVVLAAAGAIVTAATVPSLLLTRDNRRGLGIGSLATLVRIDPDSGELFGIDAGPTPSGVALGERSAWIANEEQGTVFRIDLRTGARTWIPLAASPVSLVAQRGTIVAVTGPYPVKVTVIDEASSRVRATIPADVYESPYGYVGLPRLAAGDGGVWLLNVENDELAGIELGGSEPALGPPMPLRLEQDPPIGVPNDVAAGEGGTWVIAGAPNPVLLRFDPASGRRTDLVELPFAPRRMAAGEGALWVTDELEDALWRVDPETFGAVSIPVGRGPNGVAAGLGSVWVANQLGGTVSRVDPVARRVIDTIEPTPGAEDVVAGAGGIWVTLDAP